MAWVVVNGEKRDIWDYVSRFESYDYVSRLYGVIHKEVKTNPQKVREINASFSQGRMYFENARLASTVVKPLLLYYGVLSLCSGLVLCRDQDKTETRRKHSHGLSMFGWGQLLYDGIENVLQLRIRGCSGVFQELVNVAWNKHISSIFQGVQGSRDVFPYVHNLGEVSFARGNFCFTLGDLISRSRYTGTGYQDVTGEPNRLHSVTVRLDHPNNNHIIFAFPISVGAIPNGMKKLEAKQGVRIGQGCSLIFKRGNESRPDEIPVFHYDGGYLMSVAEDFPNGDKPTEILKLYLISYALGMLARYFPSKWMSLIRNDEGGVAQPLLATATKAVENEFIGEFAMQLAELKGDAEFFGEHFGESASMMVIHWRR